MAKSICHNCKAEQTKVSKPEKVEKKCNICNVVYTCSRREHNNLETHIHKLLFIRSIKRLDDDQISQLKISHPNLFN
jgi:hypothetical protein